MMHRMRRQASKDIKNRRRMIYYYSRKPIVYRNHPVFKISFGIPMKTPQLPTVKRGPSFLLPLHGSWPPGFCQLSMEFLLPNFTRRTPIQFRKEMANNVTNLISFFFDVNRIFLFTKLRSRDHLFTKPKVTLLSGKQNRSPFQTPL